MTARGSELRTKSASGQGKAPVNATTAFGAQFSRFINYKPTQEEKAQYESWVQKANIWAIIDEVGSDGFKLTVAYDETSKAFNAMLMDRRVASPVAGCILSVRAGEASVALLRVFFIHTAVAGENWERLSLPVSDDW